MAPLLLLSMPGDFGFAALLLIPIGAVYLGLKFIQGYLEGKKGDI